MGGPQQAAKKTTPPASGPASSPAADVIDKGIQAAGAAVDVLSTAKIPDSVRALVKVAGTVVDTKANITKLDKSVQDLNNAAPGTTKLVHDTAEVFAAAAKLGDVKKVPVSFQPLAKEVQTSAQSFNTFAKDYDAYTKAPAFAIGSYSTWGVKTKAAATALSSWKGFQRDFARVETEMNKVPLQKAAKDVVNGAADAALDVLDALFK